LFLLLITVTPSVDDTVVSCARRSPPPPSFLLAHDEPAPLLLADLELGDRVSLRPLQISTLTRLGVGLSLGQATIADAVDIPALERACR
jgi:hypothetical protein